MSNSLRPHGLQHARLPCPLLPPGICSNSCPLSWWCYPTLSFSAILVFVCLQSLPASGSFPRNEFFYIRWPKYWSLSFSISPSNEYSGLISFSIDWFCLLAFQRTLKVFSRTTMCVCVCVYTHICIYVQYLYVCIHINIAFISCVHIWFYIYIYIYMLLMYFLIHTHACICTYKR